MSTLQQEEINHQVDERSSARLADAGLLLATLFWGSSFTWAKAGGDAINRISGAGAHSPVGPILLMALRFLVAGAIWLIIFPQSRRGWSLKSVGRSLILGTFMSGGMITQVLGLDRTTEAVSAFLTSLTIIWVPAIMTLGMRRPPAGIFWIGVAMAAAGIWCMTGAMPSGFGVGELLGLTCSILFAGQIIAINAIVPHDNPWRLNAGQFIVTGTCGLIVCACFAAGRASLEPKELTQILAARDVWLHLALLIPLPTLGAFGLMMYFQPRVDPSRAALIYLIEPVFAAGYAWISIGRKLGLIELLGAGLILAANVLVEFLSSRRGQEKA